MNERDERSMKAGKSEQRSRSHTVDLTASEVAHAIAEAALKKARLALPIDAKLQFGKNDCDGFRVSFRDARKSITVTRPFRGVLITEPLGSEQP